VQIKLLLLMLVVITALAGCGGSGPNPKPQPPEPAPPPSAVASCSEAATGSSPNWRQGATTVGSFGLAGPGRDFHWSGVQRQKSGQYISKVPAVANGTTPVLLRVPRSERGRVGLDYGDLWTVHSINDAQSAVTFRPCRDRPNTAWPGGLALKNRRPITLEVEIGGGQTGSLQIGTG